MTNVIETASGTHASQSSTNAADRLPNRSLRNVEWRRLIGGSILALLIFVAASSSVMFFAAAQLQARIAELSFNGVPLTIWRVDAFRDEFAVWSKEIGTLRANIDDAQRNLEIDRQKIREMEAAQQSSEIRIGIDARALQQKIEAATGTARVPGSANADLSETITSTELLLSNEDLRSRFGDELSAIKKRFAENQDLGAEIQRSEARARGFESWINKNIDQRKARVDSAARLFGETNSNVAPEIVERIVNITAELKALSTTWVYTIALWTNDLLVLLLLISMGLLGSGLNLLAVFFTNDKVSQSFGEYPLRLAFGAVLAIVMFIIAKAGVPILADTSKIGSNTPLNPYFISLLAIISGLMSDRAMGTIRNVANTLLQSVGGGDYSPRYARVSLDDALKAASRDGDGLARLLGLNAEDLTKLFSGNDVVSPDQQKLIAAYLGQKPRELFSDMPAG